MIRLDDFTPWESEEDFSDQWFEQLRIKYKDHRAQILPENLWQPLIDRWKQENPDARLWFKLHVRKNENAILYKKVMKSKGFEFTEIENKRYETPIYLETPVAGLNVDQTEMISTVKDMENRDGVLYYRNIPAPIIDLLYKEVFEERLVYPERFIQ